MSKNNLNYFKKEKKQSRVLKASELVKRTLADIFLSRNFSDQNGNSFTILVSEVSLSPDFRNARVYISKFSEFGDISNECLIKSINQESSQISREFSKNIDLRFTPKLDFKIDTLTKDSQRLESILNHLKK
ncbi:MAG: hypothetical protein CMM99_01860 [Rickettsiales bacterium]|nr:hypothetical protein [Rickettsiales bacterium]|tara:strand:- start:424 stop:816 length:393 start_codon:yes stop_codon:yes gene_type:complete